MRPARNLLVIGLAVLAPCAIAQQAAAPAPAPQAQQQEGFFRPAADPALTRFPSTSEIAAPVAESTLVVDPALLALQARERAAAERELDRAQREARANVEAVRRPAPMIASPLDGTAPIVSPLER
jgi:hypothetical protein